MPDAPTAGFLLKGQPQFRLAAEHPGDRVAYTRAKTDFIVRVTALAKTGHAKKVKSTEAVTQW